MDKLARLASVIACFGLVGFGSDQSTLLRDMSCDSLGSV